jgi:hypothetical protein
MNYECCGINTRLSRAHPVQELASKVTNYSVYSSTYSNTKIKFSFCQFRGTRTVDAVEQATSDIRVTSDP